MNANFIFVHAVNLSDKLMKISSKIRLDFLTDFDEIEIYLVEFKAAELACINQDNLSHFDQNNLQLINSTHFKTVLLSSITVYSNEQIVKTLNEIINHHDI